jgi:hypothetical protein
VDEKKRGVIMEMPAIITQAVNNIDLGVVSEQVENYAPAIAVVKNTWDKESLLEILNGQISVPDSVINSAIEEKIAGSDKVKSLTLTSQADGRLKIEADTFKVGRLELLGTVDEFVHKDSQTYAVYTVKERELPDHKVVSWIFSRISLSMAQKLVGKIDLGDDLPTTINHNTVKIDFSELLKQSDLGQTSFMGYNLLDALVIEKAEPHDGYVEFTTALNVPEPVKKMLQNIFLAAI